MYKITALLLICLIVNVTQASLFNYTKIAKFFNVKYLIGNDTRNELWHGLIRDCKKRVSFSCIQKNAYSYLDNVFIEKDNITVFDGLVLKKNKLQYQYCSNEDNVDDNVIDGTREDVDQNNCNSSQNDRTFSHDRLTPLEEITSALRQKTVKFLATRDYELQLPEFFFEGANFKISPKEIDDNGALIRVDFGQRGVENEGRIFKKIRKFIQNKLLMSFLALVLVIKLIKLKFMFVIPFLFGVGTAKKLFLKLLLFLVPAFAHVFKLCSSYYSSHRTKYHHHHHQIAHHHHHVPVPVPVPAVTPVYHHSPPFEEFEGYDYAHPHVQYRKDIEELKEWGIEPSDEPYEDVSQPIGPVYPGPYGGYKQPSVLAHNLAYSGYVNDKVNRRGSVVPVVSTISEINPSVNVAGATGIRSNPAISVVTPSIIKTAGNAVKNQQITRLSSRTKMAKQIYDDEFYGPIVQKLDEIFLQMGITDENCKVWIVCRVYKEPHIYAPNSNLVSIELSREISELPPRNPPSESSQRFHIYFNAARLGTNHEDCETHFPCANKKMK